MEGGREGESRMRKEDEKGRLWKYICLADCEIMADGMEVGDEAQKEGQMRWSILPYCDMGRGRCLLCTLRFVRNRSDGTGTGEKIVSRSVTTIVKNSLRPLSIYPLN